MIEIAETNFRRLDRGARGRRQLRRRSRGAACRDRRGSRRSFRPTPRPRRRCRSWPPCRSSPGGEPMRRPNGRAVAAPAADAAPAIRRRNGRCRGGCGRVGRRRGRRRGGEDAGAEIIEFAPVGAMPAGRMPATKLDAARCRRRRRRQDTGRPLRRSRRRGAESSRHARGTSFRCCNSIRKALPSAVMVRASHTLCGIHRTGGLPLIALTAGALEQTLLALQQMPAPHAGGRAAGAGRCRRRTREFLGRVRARQASMPRTWRSRPRSSRNSKRCAGRRTRRAPESMRETGARTGAAASAARRDAPMPRRTLRRAASSRRAAAEAVERRRAAAGRSADRAPPVAERGGGTGRVAEPDGGQPMPAAAPSAGDRAAGAGRKPAAARRCHAGAAAGRAALRRARRPEPRAARCRRIRWPKSVTTSTRRCCRSFSRRRRSSTRRPASRCGPGAAPRVTPAARGSCAGPCTRSRAARAWPGRCAWASSCT